MTERKVSIQQPVTTETCYVCLRHKGTLPGNIAETSNIDNPFHSNSLYN